VVVINTCGFLDSAKAESLEAIGAALGENGKVVVTGCMGAEPQNILAKFPDVLAITRPQDYASVLEAVRAAAPAPHDPFLDLVRSTASGSRRVTTPISKSRRAATTAALFASSRICAGLCAHARRRRFYARQKSSCARA